MIVSIAVTNSPSTSSPKSVPSTAKAPDHDDHVVDEGDQGRRPETEVAEAEGHPEQDPDRPDEDQHDRLLGQLGRR